MTLDSLQTGPASRFKPTSLLNLPFSEKTVNRHQFSNTSSLDQLVTAFQQGYVAQAIASNKLKNLCQKTMVIAASSYAPDSNSHYKRAWDRFSKFCQEHCIDPMLTDGPEVAVWLVQRSKDTKSPGMVQGDL